MKEKDTQAVIDHLYGIERALKHLGFNNAAGTKDEMGIGEKVVLNLQEINGNLSDIASSLRWLCENYSAEKEPTDSDPLPTNSRPF